MRAPRVAVGLFALTILLGGCGAANSAEVGDCLTDLDSARPRITKCTAPHVAEVVGVHEATGDEYPGAGQLQNTCQEFCHEAFEDYVGRPARDSIYDLLPVLPTEKSWVEGSDRQVLCVARNAAGEVLTESIKGTDR